MPAWQPVPRLQTFRAFNPASRQFQKSILLNYTGVTDYEALEFFHNSGVRAGKSWSEHLGRGKICRQGTGYKIEVLQKPPFEGWECACILILYPLFRTGILKICLLCYVSACINSVFPVFLSKWSKGGLGTDGTTAQNSHSFIFTILSLKLLGSFMHHQCHLPSFTLLLTQNLSYWQFQAWKTLNILCGSRRIIIDN